MTAHKIQKNYKVTRGKSAGKVYKYRCDNCLQKRQTPFTSDCKGKVDFSNFSSTPKVAKALEAGKAVKQAKRRVQRLVPPEKWVIPSVVLGGELHRIDVKFQNDPLKRNAIRKAYLKNENPIKPDGSPRILKTGTQLRAERKLALEAKS